MRLLSFLVAFGIVLAVASPGLGYRTLWADEQETAERGRAILDTGLPSIYDPSGNLSVNSAGHEIEEGTLHRYTPWLQFYTASLGLGIGRHFGLSPDASVRLPFVVLHAATSGLVAQGLVGALSFGVAPAAGIAALYGIGTVRLIHDRTARYHALTDFLFMAAWCLFGNFRRKKKTKAAFGSTALLGLTLVALLHSQTIVGFLGAAIFSILYFIEERFTRRTALIGLIVGIGACALFALVRPWEQGAIWGSFGYHKAHGLKSWFEIAYAPFFFVLSFFVLSGFRESPRPTDGWRSELILACSLLLSVIIIVRILDFHPYSQTRYYLPVVGLFLFWPIAIGGPSFAASKMCRRIYAATFIAIFLCVELGGGTPPFQGLRIVHFDATSETPQPLREVVSKIDGSGTTGSGVLMDYTPQAVNWYLPRFKPALIPDPTTLSHLGRKNANLPAMVEPEWHVSYPTTQSGFWVCNDHCDFERIGNPATSDRYSIRSKTLGKIVNFCVIGRWKTHQWNNSPFMNYQETALSPAGSPNGDLVLARRCP